MLEKLSNDANKDVLLMFTNDIEYWIIVLI
jgi:hypothetical protein